MSTDPLSDAIALAVTVHRGQLDLAGEPYILHVMRVVTTLDFDAPFVPLLSRGYSKWVEHARIVAALHDVVKDDKHGNLYGLTEIRQRFGKTIAEAVDAITKQPRETYDGYITRVIANPLARVVKHADLRDNLLPWRQPAGESVEKAETRRAKYRRALQRIIGE